MYDEDAIAYRQEQTKREPSLPHKAGRAYAHFEQIIAVDREQRALQPITKTVPMHGAKRPKKTVRVTGLVRPELDAKKFAEILVRVAIEDQKNGGGLLEIGHHKRRHQNTPSNQAESLKDKSKD